jgi:Transposase DDE domain
MALFRLGRWLLRVPHATDDERQPGVGLTYVDEPNLALLGALRLFDDGFVCHQHEVILALLPLGWPRVVLWISWLFREDLAGSNQVPDGWLDKVPDHSAFSKNRHGRFRESGAFRHLFETVLQRCMEEGLVRGEGFATDASIIKADAQKQRGMPGDETIDWGNPEEAARPVREYLAALDEANIPTTPPKAISLTDPASTWTAAGGPATFAYSTNYPIDLKAGIIVDVEASAVNKSAEVDATPTMIDRVEERFDLKPNRLVGDTNYGSAAMVGWLVEEKQIEPHVPVPDKSERDGGTFSHSDFQWDEAAIEYRCPAGKVLRSNWRPFKNVRTHMTKTESIIYRSRQSDCASCPMKADCCPTTPIRRIPRSIHEPTRDVARAIAETDAYKQSRKDRKKVEILFAHLKRILKRDKLRLRGPSGVQDQFLLAATAQNLRRMAK